MLVTMDKRGSISLPVSIRKDLGIKPGSHLELSVEAGGAIYLYPVEFYRRNPPRHPGLRIERIVNDPTAWSARVDKRYKISFEPVVFLTSGSPDWNSKLKLLRILDHDDLYKTPR